MHIIDDIRSCGICSCQLQTAQDHPSHVLGRRGLTPSFRVGTDVYQEGRCRLRSQPGTPLRTRLWVSVKCDSNLTHWDEKSTAAVHGLNSPSEARDHLRWLLVSFTEDVPGTIPKGRGLTLGSLGMIQQDQYQ